MISKGTECRDAQIKDLILQMCAQTEVNFWQTATQNSLVVTVNLAITIDITIIAITYMCTWLILFRS